MTPDESAQSGFLYVFGIIPIRCILDLWRRDWCFLATNMLIFAKTNYKVCVSDFLAKISSHTSTTAKYVRPVQIVKNARFNCARCVQIARLILTLLRIGRLRVNLKPNECHIWNIFWRDYFEWPRLTTKSHILIHTFCLLSQRRKTPPTVE